MENKVVRLIAMLDKNDPGSYRLVVTALTDMAMLGTAPASSRIDRSLPKEEQGFSERKESFIAP